MPETQRDEPGHPEWAQLGLAPEAQLVLASYLTRKLAEGPTAFADEAERRVIGALQRMLTEDASRDPEHAARLAAARARFGA